MDEWMPDSGDEHQKLATVPFSGLDGRSAATATLWPSANVFRMKVDFFFHLYFSVTHLRAARLILISG